jgi:hypothetical protein
MKRSKVLMVGSLVVLSCAAMSSVEAQYVTYYAPAAVAPAAPVLTAPTVTTYYAPAVPAPTVAAYIPSYTVARPLAYTVASPIVAPAPVEVLPPPAVPVVTYYRAPTIAYAPVPQVVTRYRPILGGTVSRVRTTYMPVVIP